MRDITKCPYDWMMDMQELSKITEEVYGIAFDIQMGERNNGEYDVITTGEINSEQGYDTGLKNAPYPQKYESQKWIQLTDDEAIERWVNQPKPGPYERPFEDINEKGEYSYYQPETAVVLTDLAKRGEIPKGTYLISIDW